MSANNLHTPAERIVALSAQVAALESDYRDLKAITLGLDHKIDKSYSDLASKMEAMTAAMSARFEAAIATINAKLEERARIPWQGWAVAVTVVIAVGTLAYWPVREGQAEFADRLEVLSALIERTADRADDHLHELQKEVVPRGEEEEKWRSFAAQHADLKAAMAREVAELQRQIDEIRKSETRNRQSE